MTFNPKKLLSNYFKKKKPFGIFLDAAFFILVLLFLIPATRTEVAGFFIRLTSFPPSTLDADEQMNVKSQTLDWQLLNNEGKTTSFGSYSDKPVFLNIWATWCPPCVAELPGIQDLYDDYGDKVNFILVSNEDPGKVNSFAEKNDYQELPFYFASNYPVDFSTRSIPTTYIISKEGQIVVNKKGAARWNSNTTRELLDQLINE